MIYHWIVVVLRPFIKWWGKLYLGFHKPQFSSADFQKVVELIQEGDILLSKTKGEFSNLINPSGSFTHSATYIGDGMIVEAVGEGVRLDRLDNFCYKKDFIALLRHKNSKKYYMAKAVSFVCSKVGHPYDMEFESKDEEFYCHELTALGQIKSGIHLKKKKILDGQFYTAESFLSGGYDILVDTRKH